MLGIGPRGLATTARPQISSNGVLMVDADLRQMVRVDQIRLVLRKLSCISEKLFVVRNQVRSVVEQACALGATNVISRPGEIIPKLVQIAEKSAQTDLVVASPETTMDIGFDTPDVRRLGIAATLHDIGKAHIPLSILD
jgi:HD-GYP domain-containing protein (c-di-GMP phosphodiesterase class II)